VAIGMQTHQIVIKTGLSLYLERGASGNLIDILPLLFSL
jgi:hypothetical protein